MKPIQPIRTSKSGKRTRSTRKSGKRKLCASSSQREGPLRKVPMHVTGWDVFKWCLFTLAVAALLIYVIAEG